MAILEFLMSASWVLLIFYIIWYFLLTDRDSILTLAEKFGRPVSYFKNKVVWITGASAGLGEAMAHELASVGAKLILTSRSREQLENVKDKCLELANGQLDEKDILVLPFDISDFEGHKTKVENALSRFGKIDVLINNAARYQIGSIVNTQTAVMKDLFDVNFFGAVSLTQNLLKHFLERGKGHIVVVSSIAGKFGIPSTASYVSAKHALHGFYETLRMEYHKENIGVTMINPGIFRSEMFGRTMGSSKGETFQKELDKYECNQMTSARCAHLTLVAAANKLFESWIAYQPFLFMLWSSQYLPDCYRYIMMTQIYTKRRVASLLDGVWPRDLPVWKPLFR